MEKIKLDLKVPRGWQFCSARELEMIAEEMIRSQMMASLSRFHPFDWVEIKTRLFFRFAEVEIVSQYVYDGDETDARYGLTTFVCRHPSLGKETFELQTWQVHSFMEQLAWLDATDSKGRAVPMPKLLWPYPERLWRLRWKRWMPTKEFYRPGEMLDGLSWQQYRLANDWMEVYTNASNALILEQEKRAKANAERIRELAVQMEDARLEVLAQLFYVSDPIRPTKVKAAPRRLLRRISEVEWQVIMFWWSSMMQYLKEQYPKCFKSSDKKPKSRSKQPPLPIELYTRSMATLQKYLGGLTEEEINAQTAHAILRHLNDMAVEAEEMEKIRKKHK
jgi:hypothetical protein